MPRHSTILHLALVASAFLGTTGCDVFDESLYQGGTATLELAERCSSGVPSVLAGPDPNPIDTEVLANDFSELATCTGRADPGNDGFFAVQMLAGERWHFHVKVASADADPAIYVLRSCDERSCLAGLDECGAGRDEHMSYVANQTGNYLIGIDSGNAGGNTYDLLVAHPVCGNGSSEHGESCDDSDLQSGDGCDAECRAELTRTAPTEVEPNDESTNANVVVLPDGAGELTVTGALGGRCDFDMYLIDVPDGHSIRATMLDSSDNPCADDVAPFRLTMVHPDGRTVAGTGSVKAGNGCPVIDDTAVFAQELDEDRYYVRVTTVNDEPTALDYRLSLEVVAP